MDVDRLPTYANEHDMVVGTMIIKHFCGLVVACVAGYLGGTLSSKTVSASHPEIVRSTRFELVNGAGATLATWGSDSTGSRMCFRYRGDAAAMEIGVFADGRPFVSMYGRDGRRRLVMQFDQADKPMLGMSDERWEGRVLLGFMPPDTWPHSNWDHWGLVFRGFGSQHAVVGMGMTNSRNSPAEPFLRIGGKNIR